MRWYRRIKARREIARRLAVQLADRNEAVRQYQDRPIPNFFRGPRDPKWWSE